jgi:hypothetical protein
MGIESTPTKVLPAPLPMGMSFGLGFLVMSWQNDGTHLLTLTLTMMVSSLIALALHLIPAQATVFDPPVPLLFLYNGNEPPSDQHFVDITPYPASSSDVFINDPSPTFLMSGTEDVRVFEWSRNIKDWKARNVSLSVRRRGGGLTIL